MIRRTPDEAVVLLHGLAANRLAMTRLAGFLKSRSYLTANWGYRSIRGSIDSFAASFQQRLVDFVSGGQFNRVHVVAHSMGGIIARRAFATFRPTNLGRLVMLAPPNGGSHVARRLATPLGRLCPPLRELSDDPWSYVNRLDAPHELEVGIIAAASDRVVKLESTMLPNQNDHIVLPGHHGLLPLRRDTADQVIHFLQHGTFDHEYV